MNELTLGTMLVWAVLGLAVGLLARLLVPGRGRDLRGWIGTLFFGVVGSFLGGMIAFKLRLGTEPFAPAGWFLAIHGAAVAVLFYDPLSAARRAA